MPSLLILIAMKRQLLSVLIVGLAFGTAWAVRGQFGHEEGASWAAAIGALALILVSGRKDWYSKILPIVLSSVLGWGACGMISYGKVVGYGRSSDFGNAWYGLLMLFVIGGLYGLLGGGLTGLSLWSGKKKRVNWASLLTEMVAGGIIFYYLLIAQMEILMTPPRSEAWAVCLGAGAALLWHMARNGYKVPLRVAFISALGAGFGFAFGNFLQITGNVLNIQFNMWNVMEYSIGFFGGASLAYAVFTSEWEEDPYEPASWENISAWAIVFAIIPAVVFLNSRLYEYLTSDSSGRASLSDITLAGSLVSLAVILTVMIASLVRIIRNTGGMKKKDVMFLFVLFIVADIFLSYSVTGAFTGSFHLNHHLYILNLIVILILMSRRFPAFFGNKGHIIEIDGTKWLVYLGVIIAITMLLAFILINMHGDLNGAGSRFPNIKPS
jgi:hypothetical protein